MLKLNEEIEDKENILATVTQRGCINLLPTSPIASVTSTSKLVLYCVLAFCEFCSSDHSKFHPALFDLIITP